MKHLIARIFGIKTNAEAELERDLAYTVGRSIEAELTAVIKENSHLKYLLEMERLAVQTVRQPRAKDGRFVKGEA